MNKYHGRNIFIYGTFSFIFICLLFYKFDVTPDIGQRDFVELSTVNRLKFLKIQEFIDGTTKEDVERTTVVPIKECECKSEKSDASYDFCYRNPKNSSLVGKRFNCTFVSTLEDLKLLGTPGQSIVDLRDSNRNESQVIFVSAISANHFGNFKQAFELIKRHWPKQKVILYSLDLTEKNVKELEAEPNIQVTYFNYSKYPKYVKNWEEYRFKAIILAEAIRDYPHVWWIDAHTRWKTPKPLDVFYKEMSTCANDVDCEKKSSMMMFINSTHSNFAVLTEGLLTYFPTYGIDTLKTNSKGLQLSAMFVYLARTPFTLEVLKWHTLCALEEKCMNPPKAKLKCDIIPRWDVYAGCFRYDQSSLNILLFNHFRNHNHYFMNVGELTRTYAHY